MGFIRGVLIVLVSVLLFTFLFATGFFATVSSSLTYENVVPRVNVIATQIIEEQIGRVTILDTLTPYLGDYCRDNSEIVQDFQGYTFVFPCEIVASGEDFLIEYAVNYLTEDFYYKEYTCEFWNCFGESDIPLFLISKYAKNYWRARFYNSLLISFVLIAGIILLYKRKSNGVMATGILLIVSSLVVLQLKTIGTFVVKLILSPLSMAFSKETTYAVLSQVVNIFFSKSGTVFVWMFVIGLVLIGGAILLKLFRVGFKISELFKKHVKEEPIKGNEKIRQNKIVKEAKPVQKPKKK